MYRYIVVWHTFFCTPRFAHRCQKTNRLVLPEVALDSDAGELQPDLSVSLVELWDIIYCNEEIWGILAVTYLNNGDIYWDH